MFVAIISNTIPFHGNKNQVSPGKPAGKVFVSKVEALYPLAYGIKKICKEQGEDFGVPKLEGLWWVEGDTPALEVPRNEWCWKLLIRMPDLVTKEMALSIQPEIEKKKKNSVIKEISSVMSG